MVDNSAGNGGVLTYQRHSLSPNRKLLLVGQWKHNSIKYTPDYCLFRIDIGERALSLEKCLRQRDSEGGAFLGWSGDSRHIYLLLANKVVRYSVASAAEDVVFSYKNKIQDPALNSTGGILFSDSVGYKSETERSEKRVLLACELRSGRCGTQYDLLETKSFYMWSDDGGVFVGDGDSLRFNKECTITEKDTDEDWVYATRENDAFYLVTRSFLYGNDNGRLFFRYLVSRAHVGGAREHVFSFVSSGTGVYISKQGVLFADYSTDGLTQLRHLNFEGNELNTALLEGDFDSPILIDSSVILRKGSNKIQLFDFRKKVQQ